MTGSKEKPGENSVPCFVYRSAKKPEAYLYVPHANNFDQVPAPLMEALGELSLVMELNLLPDQKLARANPVVVRQALTGQGYYLQPPPSRTPLMVNDRL